MVTDTFIERMRVISRNKELVKRTISNDFEEKKAERIDQLFKYLTSKYYSEIKMAIEYASVRGRQYSYMNFDGNDFKANLNGLDSPAKMQRKWLAEMCNPDSPYLITSNWVSCYDTDRLPEKQDSFRGLNFDVWNNEKFTTVFSWDSEVAKDSMHHFRRHHQMNHGVTLDVLPRNSYYPDIEMGCDIQDDTSIEGVRCVWVRK